MERSCRYSGLAIYKVVNEGVYKNVVAVLVESELSGKEIKGEL